MGSEFQKVPCDGFVNGVTGLPVFQCYSHRAGNPAEIFLDISAVQRCCLEESHGLAAKRVRTDAGGNRAVVAQARRHDSEIRWRSSKPRPLRKNVPQKLAETHHALAVAHADLGARRTARRPWFGNLCVPHEGL